MNDSTRIFYSILDRYPAFRPDVGALWGHYLPAEGVFSDLCTIGSPPPSERDWGGGRAIIAEERSSRIRNQLRGFVHDLVSLMGIRKGQYDAIQVRDKIFICLPAMLIARRLGIPFFYWMSFPMAEAALVVAARLHPLKEAVRRTVLVFRGRVGGWVLYRTVLPRADHVFAQSDKMVADLRARGVRPERMTAVPMCVDPERFAARQADLRETGSNGVVVGYLGDCSRLRRVDVLFEALRLLRARGINVRLLIIGDAHEADDQAWLRARVAESGVADAVTITGWIAPERATELLYGADLAVALMAPDPILDSTTPTKLVEYLAMGLPVVANTHPDQSRVLNESGAGLLTAFDPVAIADAIGMLAASPAMRQSMGALGPRYVSEHRNYRIMARNLAALYRQMLRPADAGGPA